MLLTIAVSSDDDEILNYAREFPGIYPIKRPPELATDETSSYAVIQHAVRNIILKYSHILLLQPTSPLRLPSDIVTGLSIGMTTKSPAVVSCEFGSDIPNGAIYIGETDWLMNGGNFDQPELDLFYMPANRSIDINTLADFERAENIINDVAR